MIDQTYIPKTVKKDASQQALLMEVRHLSLRFRQYGKGLREMKTEAITNFDMAIHHGEIVAVVGASGSGKSLLANAILSILPKNAEIGGNLIYDGEELNLKKKIQLRGKEIFLIPQSVNALDPLMKTGKQVQTVIKNKRKKKSIQQYIFQKLGLPAEAGERYPFELSGGMARRVLVAMAMASGAKLIIADEPTPGLDKAARNETLALIKQLADAGKGVMFITHDIDAASIIADRIAVFYAGKTLEVAHAKDFSGKGERLRHPYSVALWNALPQNDFSPVTDTRRLDSDLTPGCVYAPECSLATERCRKSQPAARKVEGGMVRCFHA